MVGFEQASQTKVEFEHANPGTDEEEEKKTAEW